MALLNLSFGGGGTWRNPGVWRRSLVAPVVGLGWLGRLNLGPLGVAGRFIVTAQTAQTAAAVVP